MCRRCSGVLVADAQPARSCGVEAVDVSLANVGEAAGLPSSDVPVASCMASINVKRRLPRPALVDIDFVIVSAAFGEAVEAEASGTSVKVDALLATSSGASFASTVMWAALLALPWLSETLGVLCCGSRGGCCSFTGVCASVSRRRESDCESVWPSWGMEAVLLPSLVDFGCRLDAATTADEAEVAAVVTRSFGNALTGLLALSSDEVATPPAFAL